MKNFLNPHDRFATRMKASINVNGAETTDEDELAQQLLFVEDAVIDINTGTGAL